jgi:hypothetical protein
VFPTTTVAALPVFLTGAAPQEHGMTGWHIFLKELGAVATPIKYVSRFGHFPLNKVIDIREIFDLESFFDRIKTESYVIQEKDTIDADFTIVSAGRAKRIGYGTLSENFKNVEKIVKSHSKRKFIYSYWRYHDVLCHRHGMGSTEVLSHFNKLNEKLKSFLESIEGTNTTVIITADHGMIDTPKSSIIDLREHPHFSETLTLPLCGDHRYVYCYVHPFKTDQFENYVRNEFNHYCEVLRSEDLVKKNYFGLFKPHKRFLDRIGNYVLMMKDNYAIYDFLLNKEEEYDINDHGGASKEEMYVPLIIIHT